MRAICRAWCFLFGHKVFAPSTRVQAYHFGHDAREWNMPGFTAREFRGIVRWPLYRLCRSVRDLVKTLERRIFCHQTELKELIFCAQIDRLSSEVLLSVNVRQLKQRVSTSSL